MDLPKKLCKMQENMERKQTKMMREKIRWDIILVLLLVIGSLWMGMKMESDSEKGKMNRYTATFLDVFHTKTEITGYAASEERFKEQVAHLKEKLLYYHRLYDIYNTYDGINNMKTINDYAGIEPVVVNQEIIQLLKFSKEMYQRTNGKVNIAMGSVLSIWHDYREEGMANPELARLPEMDELKLAEGYTDIEQVVINEEASTVYLENENMSLDVGGIGKGYAVQKIVDYARELGMENLVISVGGNVCILGGKASGEEWKIGILNPELDSDVQYIKNVKARDMCVVTSGNYQRYYTVDGVRYCHIIDPDTLMPANNFASVTIITKDSGVADAMSTAVYNMTLEEGRQMIDRMEDIEAMWIMENGEIFYSENFEMYISE